MITCLCHYLLFVCHHFYAYLLTLVISLNMLRISWFGFGFSFFTGFLVISTFVISEFDSVWPNNNFCSLAHKDWLLLSISYHVVFDKTWHFQWNLRGSFQDLLKSSTVFLYDIYSFYYKYVKNIAIKAFVFFRNVFSLLKTLKFEKNLKFAHSRN